MTVLLVELMMMEKKFLISKNIETLRLDKALALLNENYSREYFSFLIKHEKVKVNDRIVSPSYKVKESDVVSVEFEEKETNLNLKPYEFKLDIIYQDDDLLVINKPKGLVVHPGSGHIDDTLVNALIYNKIELSSVNGLNRVGIVHRIDKDTSGLLLIAKNDFTHNEIAKELKDHSMKRSYIALVDGIIEENDLKIVGKIGRDKNNRLKMSIDPKNGKEAITHVHVLERYLNQYTLIKCDLETGRTHQIRVHLSSIKHPLVGDLIYGGSNHIYNNGQLLHAYKLIFYHPTLKKEISLEIPLPEYFLNVLNYLKTKG